jgi:HTH-type transcriptional regulator/antitoxin HigA
LSACGQASLISQGQVTRKSLSSYEELLIEVLPRVIETERQYREIGNRFGELVGKGRMRTREETRLMRWLALLVEDYDRRNAMPPDDGTPAERLRFLMEHSGKQPADLLPVFGQRSHVNEALNGRRTISAEQARKLAKLFHVRAGVFI